MLLKMFGETGVFGMIKNRTSTNLSSSVDIPKSGHQPREVPLFHEMNSISIEDFSACLGHNGKRCSLRFCEFKLSFAP